MNRQRLIRGNTARSARLAARKRRAVNSFHRFLRRFGVDMVRYNAANFADAMRSRLVTEEAITLVLDVGANGGQYAQELRRAGYAGRIVSFEPVRAAFDVLARSSSDDPLWSCRRLALGEADGQANINVSANLWSSSLLPMTQRHLCAAPDSRYVSAEPVTIRRLDSVSGELIHDDDRVLLKLDTQGYELPVLRGAGDVLTLVAAIEAEISLTPLYESQALLPDVLSELSSLGFRLVWLAPGFVDPSSGELLQLDAVFRRASK